MAPTSDIKLLALTYNTKLTLAGGFETRPYKTGFSPLSTPLVNSPLIPP
jgi:hypothetical protein